MSKTLSSVRIHPRAKMLGQVVVHDEQHLFIAPLGDISVGGVFVHQLVNIPVGQTVKVVVRSSRLGQAIAAEGLVVRIENASRKGMAVRFTSVSESVQQAISASVFDLRMEAALKL